MATALKIEPKVEELWGKVCTRSNKSFTDGLGKCPMSSNENRLVSLRAVTMRLRVFEDIVGLLLDHAEVFELDYTHTRLLLNCKQQVNMMERIVSAINANNQGDYEAAVEALEKQAHI